MHDYPVEIRLRKKAEYDLVLLQDLRVSDTHLTLFGKSNQLAISRFGLIVSRKHGNAVKRNRIKRLLREAIRLHRHECPTGLDVVIIPRVGLVPTFEQYAKSYVNLLQKLNRKIKP